MESALYDPVAGYYASAKARIGASGDFVTAVSSGPLFGRLLARQFSEMWALLGSPASWSLIEQGAFDGRLCCDILQALQSYAPACFEATAVHLVEPFSLFQRLQAKTLEAFAPKLTWHRSLGSLPPFTGVHYSNELLDAFPFHIVRRNPDAWNELKVTAQNGTLTLQPHILTNAALHDRASQLRVDTPGFTTEICLGHTQWLGELRQKLVSGWVLAFDYGMSQNELLLPHRKDGTANAYRSQQRTSNLLAHPGEQDLTAHVNFTALTQEALNQGWNLNGYTDQHRFFTGLAPLHFQDATEKLSVAQQRELLAFRTLAHPQLMGFQFKAWCLSGGAPQPLSGFAHAGDFRAVLEI
jgi:SAM-dependent MidA family methyltransferase